MLRASGVQFRSSIMDDKPRRGGGQRGVTGRDAGQSGSIQQIQYGYRMIEKREVVVMWVYKAQKGQSECPGLDRMAGRLLDQMEYLQGNKVTG